MNVITVGQLINNNATDKDFKPLPNLDFKYGPYSSIAEALSNIPAELRAVGLTVGIRVNSTIQEFWFNGGVRDADLVVKNNGSEEAGKTPKFDKAIALALPADAVPTAEVIYKGEDESGTPLYNLEFGIPAGEAGTVPNWKTFVFKQSATQPDPPTGEDIIPAGWSDVPTVVGIWWMSVGEVRGATGKVTSWSTPIKCTGEDGVAGKYYNFKYAVNTSPSDAPVINRNADDPGSEWSDIVPAMDKGQYLWMTIGMFNDGKLEGQWSAPIRINAEDGQSGVGVRMMYQKTIDYVNAPPFDEDNINPGSAWSITIPSGSGAVWGIFAQINIDGTLASNWAGPVLMSGKPGADGTVPNWKTYIYAKSTIIPTKPTSQELIPSGWKDSPDSNDGQWWQCIGTVDGNFYVLNYEGPWKGTDQVYSTPSESYTNNQKYWIRFEGYEAIHTKIGIIANGLIGSAVFNGNYMFSQQGVDANGLKTTAYENFNPDNPGAPLNGKTFVPATLLDLKEGNAWFGHRNMNIDS